MSRNSVIDYLSCILFRLCAPIIRAVPVTLRLFLGRRLGDLFYYFDFKHKSIAYANIKTAFGTRFSPQRLSYLTKESYRSFGQNLIEIFSIPLVNKDYINRYIKFEGLPHITEGVKKGKGVILLAVHAGSWEFSNIICANLGFPLNLFIRNQRHPRLNALLNTYRKQSGTKLIEKRSQMRELIKVLKNNEVLGITVDQGSKDGILVNFLGKEASFSTGAIKLALNYDAVLIPAFYTRQKGPYIKIFIEHPFQLKKTGNKSQDIRQNLQGVVHIFERYILKYPQEYMWSYKIWKRSKEKNILILSDGKTGHLRQAQSLVKIVNRYFQDKGIGSKIDTLEVKFKNKFSRIALLLSSCFSGKYHCQGCLWCLKAFLEEETYKSLLALKPDVVISCGSAIAPVNFVISRENLAKSLVILRPSVLSTKRFDLVVMPQHDRPPKRKNVVTTEGALNLIDEIYLKEEAEEMFQATDHKLSAADSYIGLLIGGDTKDFLLSKELISQVINQLKMSLGKWDVQILISTSRRTSGDVEDLVKEEFQEYPRCKFFVIANEKNFPFAVGSILALSKIVVVSPESISMISEAASSARYVVVFASGVNSRHDNFLNHMAKQKYIYLSRPCEISSSIDKILKEQPKIHTLEDTARVTNALKKAI